MIKTDVNNYVTSHLSHLPDRLNHTLGVGEKMLQLYKDYDPYSQQQAYTLGCLHDIGYANKQTGHHGIDGAKLLTENPHYTKYADYVAWHSTAQYEAQHLGLNLRLYFPRSYNERLLYALWVADFTTSPTRTPVTYQQRLAEIKERHGESSTPVKAINDSMNEFHKALTMWNIS